MADIMAFPTAETEWIIARCMQACMFSELSQKEMSELFPLLGVRIRQYRKGETLIRMDDRVSDIGLLLNGRLNIAKEDIHGNLHLLREAVPYEAYTAEIVLTSSRTSPLNVSCKIESTVMLFPYDIIAYGGILPEAMRCKLMKSLLEMIANANIRQLYKIDILSKKSLRERVCMYLSIQQKKKSSTLSLSLNREELACYLCVDRSALSRELSRMQREGIIRYKKNHFQILSTLRSSNLP